MAKAQSDKDDTGPAPLAPGARLVLGLYKVTLSPLLAVFGARCRYAPTCSHYMAEAVSRHGLWAGGWMGLARLLRCHPFGGSGIDPVPETRRGKWYMPWRHGVWRQREEAGGEQP